ncbi:MAG: histidinol dehydrogenase, partial [Thermoleophilia bacterium]
MRTCSFDWEGATDTAAALRAWAAESAPAVDVSPIEDEVRSGGDAALLRLTERFDATLRPPQSLRIDPMEAEAAKSSLAPDVLSAMEVAAVNIRQVAKAQLATRPTEVELDQGQTVSVREVPVGAAGIYVPGGRAAYPSSVLMCVIPAQEAGVERVALTSPPGPDGRLQPMVLVA